MKIKDKTKDTLIRTIVILMFTIAIASAANIYAEYKVAKAIEKYEKTTTETVIFK